jgi:hypothetical protein
VKKDIKSARDVKDAKKKPVTAPTIAAKTAKTGKTPRTEAPKLSIDTKRAQVKAMLEADATPKGELEVVTEEMPPADAANPETLVSSPQMLQTPRKDQDRNLSPDKVSDKVSTTQMSPFKTPCKGPDGSAAKEGRHSFLQSFNSDQMSMRKSLIENPYSSFISLQSEYFDTNTRVCQIQQPAQENTQQKISQEQFETLQELIQRQQVQLDSRNDLLIQRDTEIDRLYMENSQLTKNVEQLKEKIDNQAMDVYFKVADEMNKQFKVYYTAQDSFQQMDELLDDLKEQCEQETPENKSLFTTIGNIESQMKTYEKWVQETRQELLDGSAASLPKSADIELKQQVCAVKTELTSQNVVDKEKLESLQKIVSNPSKADSQVTDYNDINSLRSTLVNTTLTNLHVLHQYKELLNLAKDNFMTRPRVNRAVTPKKPIAVQEVKVVESKTEEAAEPNSGLNPDIVTPTSVQMGQGSFKTEESKPTCDTDKDAFVQVVPETQELITLRNQVKIQTDMYNEKVQEIKKQNELTERLKRQHENLREQINRVDKENIKLKKKID